ncbi:MAG: T9SS type A sorting domain-containing protein [Ignavibacteria bacterium]|nr:T9SS type A sorting domain-containing protein [Ignavibacteria bacterium]
MKRKYLLSFVIALILNLSIFINNSMSQWVQSGNGMGTDKIVNVFETLGTNIYAGTNVNGIYVSANNGTSWSQSSLNNKTVFSFTTIGTDIYAGLLNNPNGSGGVWISVNNGANWTQTSLNSRHIISFALLGTYLFAGSDVDFWRSSNNGVNWTQLSVNSQSVRALAVIGNNLFAGTYIGVYISTNDGTSWTLTANNRSINSLAVIGTNLFAGTAQYGVYISADNGTTWSQTALNNKSVNKLAVSGTDIFAGTYPYGVYYSSNNGASWFQKNQGFSAPPFYNYTMISALKINNGYIFSGTDGFSVYRRLYSEIIGVQNISTEIPANFSLSQNYPNPFNPVTKLEFGIPELGFVSLKIYDLLGKEVGTLVDENLNPGTYKVEFDGSRLTSGVYFYRIKSGDFTDTKRMMLVK